MATSSEKKRILLSANVLKDGVGDFYHLMDVVRCQALMPNYSKDVFIHTEHNYSTVQMFKKQLEAEGYKVVFVREDEQGSDIASSLESTRQKTAFIFNANVRPNDSQNDIIKELNKHYRANISVSADIFNDIRFKKFSIPKLLITEQGGKSLLNRPTVYSGVPWLELPMNLQQGTHSIFLTREKRDNPETQLAAMLEKPENEEIRQALLGPSTDFKSITEACQIFLKNNLFIPSYLQHNPAALLNFMNIAINSPLSKGYQSVVFFVNRLEVDILEHAMLQGFLSKKISKINIKIKTNEKVVEKEIINSNASPDGKPIKIVSGYRVKEDNDYNVLFHCAQYFAGCSGDKTIEKVLSNKLLPFFIVHETGPGKLGFLEDAVKFNKQFDYMLRVHELSKLLRTILFISLKDKRSSSYTSPFDFEQILRGHNIPESVTPVIIKKWATALQTGQSFEHAGVTYHLLDYSKEDKKQVAKNFFRELEEINDKDIPARKLEELEIRFIICASDVNPKALHEFLKELKIDKDLTLVAMANTIANGLRYKKPIKLGKRQFQCDFPTEQLVSVTIAELIPCVRNYIETQFASISKAINIPFFKDWSELCIDLQKNHNLHHELPRIAHDFFGKSLKEDLDNPQQATARPPITFTSAAAVVSSLAKPTDQTVTISSAPAIVPAPTTTSPETTKQKPKS